MEAKKKDKKQSTKQLNQPYKLKYPEIDEKDLILDGEPLHYGKSEPFSKGSKNQDM